MSAILASWHGVGFRYAGTRAPALSDIAADIRSGECVLLCGPSGGGKSTLLRTLSGLVPQFHEGSMTGTVRVAGQPVDSQPLHQTAGLVSTVFQNPRSQFFTTEVAAELAFAGENLGRDPDQLRHDVLAAALSTGIEHLLDRPTHHLSGGERQLIACAGAMTEDPALQCFDEPTASLSPTAIDRFSDHLRRLRGRGQTMVIAEHRLHFLRGIIDRALFVAEGRLQHEYRAEEFFALPAQHRTRLGLRDIATPPAPADPQPLQRHPHRTQTPHGPETAGSGLTITDLRLRRGRRTILDIPSAHFAAGRVHALTGPNGAGKTTLAHVLCGLASAQTGRIAIDGHPLSRRRRRNLVTLVHQEVHRQLFTDSVHRELAAGCGRERANELLAEFDLLPLSERHPLSLSGGQMQRLAIAQAASTRRPVIVLDEPTSGLDLSRMKQVAESLRQLAEKGMTVLVITHDRELIAHAVDQVWELAALSTTPEPGATQRKAGFR